MVVERGGFVPIPALQHPALLVTVLIAVHVDAATVTQFERVVLDLLPVFLHNELLLFDPRQQAVGMLAVFLHFLFGQLPAAVFLFPAPSFLVRVPIAEDHQVEAGITGEFERQLVAVLLVDHGGPARKEFGQPSWSLTGCREELCIDIVDTMPLLMP